MYQQAILKLKAEIDKSKNNPYVQVVGGFLLGHLDQNQGDADKVMSADKTIAKSLEAMKQEASKKKVGNCAILTDQEGFAVVLKYFGIKSAVVTEPTAVVDQKTKSKVDFDISLDDLL